VSSAPAAAEKPAKGPTRKKRRQIPDPTTRYARDVVAGRIVACKFVRQAAQRHLDDLRDGGKRGLSFDRKEALRWIAYFRTQKHVDGPFVGQYIVLEPWQEFITGALAGWFRGDVRRFRQAYIEVSKKQGKSTWVAGIVRLLTFHDGEIGAKSYCAATTREQTKNVFETASMQVLQAPQERRRLKVHKYLISDPKRGQQLHAVGARENSLEGLRPKALVIDELHLHQTPAVLETLRRGQRAQRQPMCIMITTAGWNRNSVCWRERELARKILDPVEAYDDDREFVYIATLDDDDDYHDERVWVKAMPNLDVSVSREDVRADIARADAEPEELPALLQKIFNKWVSNSIDRAIDMTLWDTKELLVPVDEETLRGRHCFPALDLARVRDLSSLSLVFPPIEEGELFKYLGFHFIPEDDIKERSRRDGVPYAKWLAEGKVIGTSGDTTDLDAVGDKLLEVAKLYELRELAYDPTFATDIANRAKAAGLTVFEHYQNYSAMSLPCAELLRLVRSKALQHGGDPVARWCMDNLVMRSGPSKRLLPDKERSREKIDAAVAIIMSVGRAAISPPPAVNPYNERGVRRLGE
jgi:phage terminase large subunit-like protein